MFITFHTVWSILPKNHPCHTSHSATFSINLHICALPQTTAKFLSLSQWIDFFARQHSHHWDSPLRWAMAYRIFVGGLPSWCSTNGLWMWCQNCTGQQPVHCSVPHIHHNATMCVVFLGFATHGTMQSVLQQLQAVRFFGHRISVRVSRWSQQPPAATPKAQPKALVRSLGTQTAGPSVATMATQTESPPAEEEELSSSPSPLGPVSPATPPTRAALHLLHQLKAKRVHLQKRCLQNVFCLQN